MKLIKSFLKNLKAFDLVVVVFFILLIIINIIYRDKVDQWLIFVFMNVGIILFAFLIAFLENKSDARIWRVMHYWYIAPLIMITFKELYFMIKPLRPVDYDTLFIQIDRWMFGTDPTYFFYQYSHPIITEILQIVYGFYLSYIGYFALPGVGPRFTLHNFETINEELPGLFLTNPLREFVNIGESIPEGTQNPAEVVQRDVFTSGHTMLTLIVMYLSVRLRSRSKYFFVLVGSLLIIATVYLRYHYVIDLIGGLVLMIFSVWSGKYLFNWWRRKTGLEEFEYKKA